MARPGFRWNRPGYYAFMREQAVPILDLMEKKAQEIADDATAAINGQGGRDDFRVESQKESGRRRTPRTAVIAASVEANLAEGEKRVLTRAVEANRD